MKHTTIYCPAHIEFLLACHANPDYFERQDAPVLSELIPEWLEAGVIERYSPFDASPTTKPNYRTTALGKAWVQALCNVPLPKAAFIDDQGRILNYNPHAH